MAELKLKEQEQIEIPEPTIDNKLELIKSLSQVKSSIKDVITEDFVLAKLGDKDKEAIIEMVANANYGKQLVNTIILISKEWKWNKKEKKWELESINIESKNHLEKMGKRLFDTFMSRIYMTVILNRNTKNNHLVRLIAGQTEEETEDNTIEQSNETIEAIKEAVKQNEQK